MQKRNGSNAWDSKKKSSGDDHRHGVESWPQLREPDVSTKRNQVESWPTLPRSHLRKSKKGHQELESIPNMGYNGGNILMAELPKPSVLKEMHDLSDKPYSNECKHLENPVNLGSMANATMLDFMCLDQHSQIGESNKVTLSSKESKKEAFKKWSKEREKEKKAERRRKKEEDTLRKMLGPKGLKVTVIDNNAFLKLSDVNDRSSTQPYHNSEVKFDTAAFPELRTNSVKLGGKRDSSRSQKILNSPLFGDNEVKGCNPMDNLEGPSIGNTQKPTKSKKRRDPVVVDIWKAIEICKVGKKSVANLEENFVRLSKSKKERCRIAGNILDASNPLRHRGKKREVPKRRHQTRLKKAILAERKLRREARYCVSKSDALVNVIVNEAKALNFASEIQDFVPGFKDSSWVTQASKSLTAEEGKGEASIDCLSKSCTTVPVDIDQMTKDSLHSRRFREYCNHLKSADLSENVKLMLKDILKFQDRMHATQPIKAESHRRYIVGLRQTQNLLAVYKVKIVILAQDLEKVPSPGGLDDIVNSIIASADQQNVPVVFPLTRRQLGKVTYRKVGVSCVGVLNYQGSEENFKKIISSLEDSKKDYREKFEKEKCRITSELGITPIKKEERLKAVSEVQVNCDSQIDCAVTLPLLQKLTEALSEMSIGTASKKPIKEESIDL